MRSKLLVDMALWLRRGTYLSWPAKAASWAMCVFFHPSRVKLHEHNRVDGWVTTCSICGRRKVQYPPLEDWIR